MEHNYDILTELARQSIRITWEMTDDEYDVLQREAEDAVNMLETYVGTGLDFEAPGLARRLFLACVRYIHNDSEELFVNNFNNDLNSLRLNVATRRMEEEDGDNQHKQA